MAHVFLDLDGMLTDPKEGITRSVVHALEAMGQAAPEADALDWVIGPALVDSFARLGVEDVQTALAHYRARFGEVGLFENRPYDGIAEVLAALRQAGHVLCLATAKPHVFARRITGRFGLAPYLAHEFGPELDGTRNDKGALLAHALEVTGADPARAVMVGDRHHDSRAARAVGSRQPRRAGGGDEGGGGDLGLWQRGGMGRGRYAVPRPARPAGGDRGAAGLMGGGQLALAERPGS